MQGSRSSQSMRTLPESFLCYQYKVWVQKAVGGHRVLSQRYHP